MKKLASALAPFAVLLLMSCSSSETDAGDTGPTVHIKSFSFTPKEITIKTGQIVTWKWDEGTHSVSSGNNCTADGKFSSGQPVAGGTFDHRFDAAGTYDYFCDPHCISQGMTGRVIVAP